MRIILFILASFYLSSDEHEQSFEGLLSSERFNIDGGMELVIEKRSTCNAGNTPKHFHPAAGTVVYVLDGVSQSKSTGQWKQYSKGEYWFERSDWVHGGEVDAPFPFHVAGLKSVRPVLLIRPTGLQGRCLGH